MIYHTDEVSKEKEQRLIVYDLVTRYGPQISCQRKWLTNDDTRLYENTSEYFWAAVYTKEGVESSNEGHCSPWNAL